MAKVITVVIADDHPLIRQGLRAVLEHQAGVRVEKEAENGEEALALLRELRPTVAVVDIEMPQLDGFGVMRQADREGLPTAVIFLTMYREEHVFNKALDEGVRGYVLKENAIEDIVQAVKAVAGGSYYVSPSIAEYLVRRSGREPSRRTGGIDQLTPAERNVLRLLAEMKTSQEIAEALAISTKTVSNHRNNIAAKLGIRGSHGLLKFAVENRGRM